MNTREGVGAGVPLPTDYYATESGEDRAEDAEGEDTYKGHRDAYTAYYGQEWREIRERVLERAGYECESCGLSNEEHIKRDDLFGAGLHVHHNTPAKDFDTYEGANALSNLTALCADCHRETENE